MTNFIKTKLLRNAKNNQLQIIISRKFLKKEDPVLLKQLDNHSNILFIKLKKEKEKL